MSSNMGEQYCIYKIKQLNSKTKAIMESGLDLVDPLFFFINFNEKPSILLINYTNRAGELDKFDIFVLLCINTNEKNIDKKKKQVQEYQQERK